mmetsp:Transcript_25397/g.55218  ORF Transcript_25397/g.55218 Transcript_25397/m.55218 type:complete len:438 (-) Transcript_25397:123-1436(-)
MVLDGHRLLVGPHHAGAGAVVEVDVGHLHARGEGLGVHGVVVVLSADLHAPGGLVRDGVVAAMVPEGQLVGLAAERLAQHLVAHADAEDGHLAEDGLRVGHRPGGGGGVAGAVGEEDTVGVHGQHLVRGGLAGHHRHLAPVGGQAPEDVGLDAIVVRHHVVLVGVGVLGVELPAGNGGVLPLVRLVAGHHGQVVLALNGPALGHIQQLVVSLGGLGGDDTNKSTLVADTAGQLTGVNIGDADNVLLLKVGVQRLLRAVVGDDGGVGTDDDSSEVALLRLHVVLVDSDVADVRAGEADSLTSVTGVGHNLLVSRERCVEDNLLHDSALGAESDASEHATVREHQAGVVLGPRAVANRRGNLHGAGATGGRPGGTHSLGAAGLTRDGHRVTAERLLGGQVSNRCGRGARAAGVHRGGPQNRLGGGKRASHCVVVDFKMK